MTTRPLDQAIVLLTGATSGIGRAAALALAPRVGALILHGPERTAESTLDEVGARMRSGEAHYLSADYRRLADVVDLAQQCRSIAGGIDVVVNNAGLAGAPRRSITADGNETTLQVDYLGPVLLTLVLLAQRGGRPLRVVNVASATHVGAPLDLDDLDLQHGYSAVAAYSRAKLALVTESCRLAAHAPHGVEVVSVHPGVVATGLLHAMFTVGGEGPAAAGEVLSQLAGRRGDNGTYYDHTRPGAPDPRARDPRVQDQLHTLTAARLEPFLPVPTGSGIPQE